MGKGIPGFLDVINSLTSPSQTKPLAAAQGQILRKLLEVSQKEINGLHIKYNSSTLLDIEPGICWDDTYTDVIELPSGITKNAVAAWVQGTGNGGNESGMTTNAGDTLHAFVIKNPNTGDVDAIFSNNLTPSLPTGFTLKRRVGSIVYGAPNIIRQFTTKGDYLFYADFTLGYVNSNAPTNTHVDVVMPVPVGIQVLAEIIHSSTDSSGVGGGIIQFMETSKTFVNPIGYDISQSDFQSMDRYVLTDTQGRIRFYANTSNSPFDIRFLTVTHFLDFRL